MEERHAAQTLLHSCVVESQAQDFGKKMTISELAKMSPEHKCNKIAGIMGWVFGPEGDPENWYQPDGIPSANNEPPDFLNDLNAMHEAEKTITDPEQFLAYERNVCKIVIPGSHYRKVLSATATQRADAFLLTFA